MQAGGMSCMTEKKCLIVGVTRRQLCADMSATSGISSMTAKTVESRDLSPLKTIEKD